MNSNNNKILGWHFSEDTKLGFKDNRPIIIGETLSVKGKIVPCEFGLHASKKALDAFQYVHGKYLWRVELEGNLRSHKGPNRIVDKWVGRKRKVLAGGDATKMLLKFGRDCVLEVLHLLPDAPPEEVKTFLETGVITKAVKNYFCNSNNVFVYYAVNVHNATYCAYKNSLHNVHDVRNVIKYTAKALDVPFEAYTDKFEEACLEFISSQKS